MSENKCIAERLYTKRLMIERMEETDQKFFFELTSDFLVRSFFWNWADDWKNYFYQEVLKKQTDKNLYLIIRLTDSTPIGILNAFYLSNGKWLIEYAMLESFRNRGFMQEVLHELFHNTFQFLNAFNADLNMTEVVFDIEPDNNVSKHVVLKVAMDCHLKTFRMANLITIRL